MSEMLKDIEGVEVAVDNILIWGNNEEEYNTRLDKVLRWGHSQNFKINKDKSQIKQNKITYIGHILSEQGVKSDL